MIKAILGILSAALFIYTLLCFVYIVMSWIPGAKFTKFGKTIASICEPYLNFFSRWGILRFGNIDFSPILSIGLLSLLSSILSGINATGRIRFGHILATIISMIWNIVSILIGIFTLLVLIRWIVLLINHGKTNYDSAWTPVDKMISTITYKISGTFIKKSHNYQTSLLVTWISFVVINVAAGLIINLLLGLCYTIPF